MLCMTPWFCAFSLFLVSAQPLKEKETWQVLNVEVHTSQRLFIWNKLSISESGDSMEGFQCSSCSQTFCSAQLVRNADAIRHRIGVWMNWMAVNIMGQINKHMEQLGFTCSNQRSQPEFLPSKEKQTALQHHRYHANLHVFKKEAKLTARYYKLLFS